LIGEAIHPAGIPSLIQDTIASALLVGGLYYGKLGSLSRLLSTSPLRFLGRVSYSLYLLNVMLLHSVWMFTDRWEWTKGREIEAGLFVGVLVLFLTIPLSQVMERWVERPGINLGRKVCERLPALFSQVRRFAQRATVQSTTMLRSALIWILEDFSRRLSPPERPAQHL